MLGAALVAFGHFLAFFALSAALVLELTLLTESLSVETARRIQRADLALGLSATLLLVFGILRVFYFDKGSEFYLGNVFFWIKILLFVTAGIISIYPSMIYRRWSSELQQDIAPDLSSDMVTRLKKIIHWELVLIGGILICASLMAKGFGTW